MLQLKVYSYVSQLTFIFLVSLVIYIYLVNILLPTIGITLKIRANIIENRVNTVKEVVDMSRKSQKQIYVMLEKILELMSNIANNIKEEQLNKEINIIMVEGVMVEGMIEEDLVEEFVLQSVKISIVNIISENV